MDLKKDNPKKVTLKKTLSKKDPKKRSFQKSSKNRFVVVVVFSISPELIQSKHYTINKTLNFRTTYSNTFLHNWLLKICLTKNKFCLLVNKFIVLTPNLAFCSKIFAVSKILSDFIH
ncbi:hypothetical protein BpHYR1_011469 [Brachionus plicatilis]|uniref:Uncharacterized protein n=1 Tax=Brachionus plicatilis TaxID=10195 RepID=A0A3M7QFR5_BRAPC|nr:hypothetical protein BpHYR1_011469 [Brachionus plicatilis]